MPDARYPARPSYFAHWFVRAMGRARLAAEVGPDVCWLLAFVAHAEDARRYRGPVAFFNDDLAAQLGLSLAGFKRARDRAVGAGWLVYEPGAKGRPARYYVTAPDGVGGDDDGRADADAAHIPAQPEPDVSQNPAIPAQAEPHLSHERAASEPDVSRKPAIPAQNRTASEPQVSHLKTPYALNPEDPHPHALAGTHAHAHAREGGEGFDPDGAGFVRPPPLAELVAAWAAAGLPAATETPTRRGHWQMRCADPWFAEHWREAVERAGRSPRCRGDAGDWRATVDWFLRTPDAARRLLEGEFDPPPPAARARDSPAASGAAARGRAFAAKYGGGGS